MNDVIAAAQSLAVETVRGPIDVRVTGPSGGIGITDFLAPAAVIVAAFLAYLFATKNVKREIAAAETRQATELRHDRELQVLAGTRETVDDATKALSSAIDAFAEFFAKTLGAEFVHHQMENAPEGSEIREAFKGRWVEMASETTDDTGLAVTRLSALQAALLRLRLRFPRITICASNTAAPSTPSINSTTCTGEKG